MGGVWEAQTAVLLAGRERHSWLVGGVHDRDGDGLCDPDDPCPDLALEADLDGDGFWSCDDCDDTVAAVNPGATEIAGNGLDDDCVDGDAARPSSSPDTTAPPEVTEEPGCGCAGSGGAPGGLLVGLALLAFRRRSAPIR